MSGAILQSGPVVPGHVAVFVDNGVVQDGGTAGNGIVSSIGIENDGSLGIAINSGAITGPFVQFGIISNADGDITLVANSFNGAPPATMFWDINGVTYPFNPTGSGNVTGPASAVSGDLASFNGTNGNLIRDSGVAAARVVTGPTIAVSGDVVTFNGTGGNLIQDSTIAAANLVQSPGGATISTVMKPVVDAATITSALGLLNAGNSVFSVLYYGADPTGVADSTTAIQGAINAAQTAGGGMIWFPAGTYMIAGTLQITKNGIAIFGAGVNATYLSFQNTSLDCITVEGTSSVQLEGFSLQNMTINQSGKTGGRLIYMTYCAYCRVVNVVANNPWTGIEVYIANTIDLEDITVQGVAGGVGTWGIYWHSPGTGAANTNSTALTIENVTIQALYSGADGMVWDGYATTLNVDQLTFLECRYGLHILNTAASNAYYPQFGSFNNLNTDGISSIGLLIAAGNQFTFTNSNILNTSGEAGQGSADTNAMVIYADTGNSFTRDITFVGGQIGLSRQTGVYISCYGAAFIGVVFDSGATTPPATWAAIEIAPPSEDITITGCKTTIYGSSNDWAYGIMVDAGTERILVGLNDFSTASDVPVVWKNTDAQSRCFLNMSTGAQSYDPAPSMVPAAVNSTSGTTLSAADLLGGVMVRSGTSAPFNDTTPTAGQLVAGLQNPAFGIGVPLLLINAAAYTQTLLAGSGVTFAGNLISFPTTATVTQRHLVIYFTNTTPGSEAVTIYG